MITALYRRSAVIRALHYNNPRRSIFLTNFEVLNIVMFWVFEIFSLLK